MSEHLTDIEIRNFQTGGLSPEGLLAASDHLEDCASCRDRLSPRPGVPLSPPLELFHLTYDELAALASGGPIDFKTAGHMRACPECRAELDDLKSVNRRPSPPRRPYWIAAAAVAAVAVVAVALMRPGTAPIARTAVEPSLLDRELAVAKGMTEEDRQLLTSALKDGTLEVAAPNAEVASQRSVPSGAGSQAPAFDLLAPSGVTILADRPVFRWKALAGATRYRVEIFDLTFDPVATSPEVAATEWTPSTPLPRGKTFTWQVIAFNGGARVTAPQPPEAEARFHILSREAAAEIARVQALQPPSHLLIALKMAQAGLNAEAAKELDIVAAANPNSPVVQSLRAKLAN